MHFYTKFIDIDLWPWSLTFHPYYSLYSLISLIPSRHSWLKLKLFSQSSVTFDLYDKTSHPLSLLSSNQCLKKLNSPANPSVMAVCSSLVGARSGQTKSMVPAMNMNKNMQKNSATIARQVLTEHLQHFRFVVLRLSSIFLFFPLQFMLMM